MMSIPVITVDGPSGTGKGTLCGRVAYSLGWNLLDSGALYRVLGHAAQRDHISFENTEALVAAAHDLDLAFVQTGDWIEVRLNGQDISSEIRTETAGNSASKVAAIPAVRDALFNRQLAFQKAPGLVADGRDMGTVVFPNAELKIYLTASADVRAQRRYKQLKQKGIDANLAHLLNEIAERDQRDAGREVAPLKPAEDAILIDTSDLTIDQVTQKVLMLAEKKFDLT